MKEYAFTVNLKDEPGVIEQYEAYHDAIWPEVAESLKTVGMQQVKIWRLGRRLFMLITTDDAFDPDQAAIVHRASHPRVLEWEELMDSFQEPVPEADNVSTWAEMGRVFTLTPP